MNFLLWEVACNGDVQSRLYAEIRDTLEDAGTNQLEYEALEGMAFTRAVIKEGLRINPAIFNGAHQAMEDDVIPLSRPILSLSGKQQDHIAVQKGQRIVRPHFSDGSS